MAKQPIAELRATIAKAGLEYRGVIERDELERLAEKAQKHMREEQPVPEREASGLFSRAAAQRTRVVHIRALLSDEEIESVHQLARSVGREQNHHGGGERHDAAWDTIYLSARLRFGRALPRVRQKLIDAAWRAEAEAKWCALPPTADDCGWSATPTGGTPALVDPRDRPQLQQVHPRVVEYHTVGKHGSLPWVQHQDHGSIYTVDVMLSDRGQFEGGTFQTLEPSGHLRQHTDFQKGDALVFVSHKPHCVAPVTRGQRNVLVCELWKGEERPCAHRCKQPWGACSGRGD